jgi:hypothetical protein
MFGLALLKPLLIRHSALLWKIGAFLLVLLVLKGYGIHKENQGYERGKAELQAKIDQFRKDMEAIKVQHKKDLEDLGNEQAQIQGELAAKLDESNATAAALAVELKKAKTYVTAKADAACVLSAGAVSLWNLPLDPSGGALAGVSEGGRPDVDAPSGVALSKASEVIASNNAECVQRGEVIEAWQSWYRQNREAWEKFRSKRIEAPAGP